MPQIHFYLPFKKNTSLPVTLSDYWHWQITTKVLSNRWGIYHWVLQTYLHLKTAGIPCQLVQSMPQEGILITHHDLIPKKIKPNKNLIIIDLLVDRDITSYRFANFYIVHNPNQTSFSSRNVYIPPWPQVSLIPRSKERGDIFENIAYVGAPEQLAGKLHSEGFRKRLQDMGLQWWTIFERKQWNDFSKVDAVIAVRSFDGNSRYQHKSAIKLINAWFAGVPAILGPESAFRAIGESDNDYLEVSSVEGIVKALLLLKRDVTLCKKLVENGRQKAKEFSEEKISAYWQDFLFSRFIPYYREFNRSAFKRIAFFLQCNLIRAIFNQIGTRLRSCTPFLP